MNLIKAQFLNKFTDLPSGRHYTYMTGTELEVGDLVQLNKDGVGIVTETNVAEEEVAEFKDRLKTIIGKVELEGKDE